MRVRAVLAMAVAMMTVSCGANGGVDVASLEADLAPLVLPEHTELVGAVSCPEPLQPEPGDQIVCDVGIGADVARLQLTFGEGNGEVANVTVIDRLVDVSEVGQTLAEQLSAQVQLSTTVTCPQAVMVLAVDEAVVCTATDPSGIARDLAVTIGEDRRLVLTLL